MNIIELMKHFTPFVMYITLTGNCKMIFREML